MSTSRSISLSTCWVLVLTVSGYHCGNMVEPDETLFVDLSAATNAMGTTRGRHHLHD